MSGGAVGGSCGRWEGGSHTQASPIPWQVALTLEGRALADLAVVPRAPVAVGIIQRVRHLLPSRRVVGREVLVAVVVEHVTNLEVGRLFPDGVGGTLLGANEPKGSEGEGWRQHASLSLAVTRPLCASHLLKVAPLAQRVQSNDD